jgi:hypothetical protein
LLGVLCDYYLVERILWLEEQLEVAFLERVNCVVLRAGSGFGSFGRLRRADGILWKGGELRGGMGKGATPMGSWCEIAPPQMITVERCSPRQKTMETILERMAALGATVETAPPQIILVERSLSQKRGSLDTIAEESISMAVDLANGAAAAAVRPLSSRRLESLSPSPSSSSSSQVRRITPGFVACN